MAQPSSSERVASPATPLCIRRHSQASESYGIGHIRQFRSQHMSAARQEDAHGLGPPRSHGDEGGPGVAPCSEPSSAYAMIEVSACRQRFRKSCPKKPQNECKLLLTCWVADQGNIDTELRGKKPEASGIRSFVSFAITAAADRTTASSFVCATVNSLVGQLMTRRAIPITLQQQAITTSFAPQASRRFAQPHMLRQFSASDSFQVSSREAVRIVMRHRNNQTRHPDQLRHTARLWAFAADEGAVATVTAE
ncbi:hypothetical protein DOTSEDRAFT_32122 [Dothistroma septosporum NZE10]|uniref:Uncharacterized protein n=1 Tax=Dothistroma septosporum (strain NZE10 / CBS 128990) TaxID=675120 RepID=N1PZD0_DOTSN|nr:hypothetical protein DOTSEDRAFT_32122 [Dothistroma septosporum NZE10]